MITFIIDTYPSTPNNISNGCDINGQKEFFHDIAGDYITSKAIGYKTIEHSINSTEEMQIKSIDDVDFNNEDTYVYPVFTTELLTIFGFTHHLIYEHNEESGHTEPKKLTIDPVFKFLPQQVIEKAIKKELYIAVMSICEGKAYTEGWESVSKACNTYNIPESQVILVLGGNHSNYAHKTENFKNKSYIHLNYYALELSCKIRTGYTKVLDNLNSEKKKHYICLNSQIKPHRYHMVSNLLHNGILENGYVSCQNYQSHVNNFSQIKDVYAMKETLRKDGANVLEFIKFYNTLPYVVDSINDENYNNALHAPWTYDPNLNELSFKTAIDVTASQIDTCYKSAVIDVITETANRGHHVNFITEKTFKAIMYKMPFIISGDKGINKELLRHGFKLYDMLFDYSFDEYDSYVDRNNAITKQLKRYCEMPLEQFTDRVNQDDVQEVVEHNFKILETNNVWLNFCNDLKLLIT
jgi:hypothetical protein